MIKITHDDHYCSILSCEAKEEPDILVDDRWNHWLNQHQHSTTIITDIIEKCITLTLIHNT
jgi:hypothetical protein